MLSTNCTAPRLKLVVLTHPWTKLDTEVRVDPYMASCSWKNIAFIFVNMQVVSRDWRWDHEKFLRLSWRVVPAKVTPARDQQSLCHWLTLRPAQRLFWDAITLLPLFFIKVAVGTIAFFLCWLTVTLTVNPPTFIRWNNSNTDIAVVGHHLWHLLLMTLAH